MIYPVAAQKECINPEWQMTNFIYLQKDLSSIKISYKWKTKEDIELKAMKIAHLIIWVCINKYDCIIWSNSAFQSIKYCIIVCFFCSSQKKQFSFFCVFLT